MPVVKYAIIVTIKTKKNKKNLSIRKWTCPEFGTYYNRDINASINILNQGLKDLELAV